MALFCVQGGRRLKEEGAEASDLKVSTAWIVDMEVQVDLLRRPVGPLGCNVIGRQLDAEAPLPISVDDAVPVILSNDSTAEYGGPERALGSEVNRVEDNDLTFNDHETRHY